VTEAHPARTRAITLALGIAVLVIDRLHKYVQIELHGWRGGEFVPVTGFFDYVLVWNTGIAYGLLTDVPLIVLLLLMGAAMLLLAVWWWRAEGLLARSGLAIILGGALSHVADRMIYGAVPDFFHFHWDKWSFYVFNVSDAAITLGAVLLILDSLLPGRSRRSQPQ